MKLFSYICENILVNILTVYKGALGESLQDFPDGKVFTLLHEYKQKVRCNSQGFPFPLLKLYCTNL